MSAKRVLGAAAVAIALAAGLVGLARAADDEKPIDDEGFIRSWLMIAPFPFPEGDDAEKVLDTQQIKDEAKLEPKEGDKAKAGDKELTWKKHQAKDYFFDFNAQLGNVTEHSTGYVACYVVAEKEMPGLTMKVGSDDLCKIYLNGKEVHKSTAERALEKDQDTVPDVTLKKGTNVLVVKVVNTIVDWSGCVRFVDKDGNPVKGLKVQLTK